MAVYLPLLTDLVRDYPPEELRRLGEHLLNSSEPDQQASGILFTAAHTYAQRQAEAALFQLFDARRLLGVMPLPIMANVLWLSRQLGREQNAAHECLQFARDALSMDYPDLGLEAATAAYILDGMSRFDLMRNPDLLAETGHLYRRAAGQAGLKPPARAPLPDKERYRVALLVPNLVDYVVAYTKRVLQLVRFMDPARFEARVYVSENLSTRLNPMFPFGCIQGDTETTGAQTLAALRQAGVPVWQAPRDVPFTEAARRLLARLNADAVDIVIVQSGMACPIDWLAIYAADAPVRAGIHIGTSYYGAGLNLMFVDNPSNVARESNWDESTDGRRIVVRKGTDLDLIEATPSLPRAALRIPPDAVLIGTLSNHLDKRLSTEYLETIARVMKNHPGAWFVPIGSALLPDKLAVFQRHGLAGRVRFAGRQLQSAAALKLLDIYASEFPVGGSQSVIEAMACGLPVVALRWSDAHAESVASEIIGPPYGLLNRDLDAYEKRLSHLIGNPLARRDAGISMKLRARQLFSAPVYVHSIMNACVNAT